MCDHAQHVAMPDRIAHLIPGKETPSEMLICEIDGDHPVVDDAWAIWDPHLQDHVHEESMGEEICNECSGPLKTEEYHILNSVAIKQSRDRITHELRALTARLAQPLDAGPGPISSSGSSARVWLKEVCGHCGAEGPLIDAYSEYDPTTLTHDLTTTFDKGHYCRACDGDTRPKTERLSNHEVMALVPDIKARIVRLEQELAEFDRWVVAHAPEYCVNAEWIEKIAKAAGCPEQVCTA